MTRVQKDWLALTLVKGVGQKTIRALLDRFGGIGPLLDAEASAISGATGLSANLAARIADAREVQAFAMERRLIEQHGIRLLCLDDEEYPPLLRQIHVPPPILYFRGEVPLPEGLYLAVVGTRRQSRYGERASRHLIEQLASAVPDLVVVSGLVGVDIDAKARRLARAELMLAGLPNCSLRQGDMYRLPFVDGEFNTIILDDVLADATDPVRALSEARRLLKSGGRLFILQAVGDRTPASIQISLAEWSAEATLRLAPAHFVPARNPVWLLSVATVADSKDAAA